MKILFIAPYMPSLIRVRPFNLIKQLSKNHQVTVLALAQYEQEMRDAEALRNHCFSVEPIFQSHRQSYLNCLKALPAPMPLQVAYCYSPKLIARAQELIENDSFDLVHVEFMRAAYVVDYLPREIPKIFDGVDSRTAYLRQLIKFKKNPWSKALAFEELLKMKSYEPKMCSKFDKVLMVSEKDAREIEALQLPATDGLGPADGGVNIEVIPNGVDLDYFKNVGEHHGEETITFSGKMGYWPNIQAVLFFYHKVFPLIREKRPDCKFVIVGNGPPKAILRLAKDPAVTVTGYVGDIRPYLMRSTVVAIPINIGVGIQNKVMEALAMRAPVVATPLACQGLGITPGENILVAERPEEFAHQILHLLDDEELRRKLGQAGRAYVEKNHNWSDKMKRLERLYQEVLEEK